MICCKCGKQIADGVKFCSECGASQLGPEQPKSKKGLIIGIVAAVVALAVIATLVLVFAGGEEEPAATNAPTVVTTVAPTEATTVPTEVTTEPTEVTTEPTEATTEPTEPPTFVIQEATLTYEMTEEDVTAYNEKLKATEELAMTSTDEEAVLAAFEELDALYDYIGSQHSVAMVLYYCDLSNEEASELYLETTEIFTQANNDYIEAARRIYQADVPTKAAIFEEWTEQDLKMLELYTSEIMELKQRKSELEVAYQDIQDDPNFASKMIPLYVETVVNNNRMAQIYGYENYYVYAYEMGYSRDYEPEKIEQMRQYAADYLIPASGGALMDFQSKFQVLGTVEQQKVITLLEGNFDETYDPYVEEYLMSLPDPMRRDMLQMFNGNVFMMPEDSNAMEGAFTTAVGTDRVIGFFGPGYKSSTTLVHEVGHYYGAQYTFLDEIPLDLAETQSQGNEWLFMCYMKDRLEPATYDSVISYKMYSDIGTILISLMVDEFEQMVYTCEDPAKLTEAKLEAFMEQVCERYGGIDYVAGVYADMQYYWRMVTLEQPCYYVSYAVSAVAAMNIYTIGTEDYAAALESYRLVNEEADIEGGFLATLAAAGLPGPFDEAVYEDIYELFD